jgi:hypothetical protein
MLFFLIHFFLLPNNTTTKHGEQFLLRIVSHVNARVPQKPRNITRGFVATQTMNQRATLVASITRATCRNIQPTNVKPARVDS